MSGWIDTTCQRCGKPARARKLVTGCGVFLHLAREGHAVVPDPRDEQLRLDYDAPPTMVDAPVKDGLL